MRKAMKTRCYFTWKFMYRCVAFFAILRERKVQNVCVAYCYITCNLHVA